MSALTIDIRPAGAVAAAFRAAKPRGFVDPVTGKAIGAGVKLLNGPIGSAKTTENFLTHMTHAMAQPRSALDGKRHYRLACVNLTYPTLWRNLIPAWHELFPGSIGEEVGSTNRPYTHTLGWPMPDGGEVVFTLDFLAIGDASIELTMKGYQVTSWYLNEIDQLDPKVLRYAIGRCGRYPHARHGVTSDWVGVTGDFNKPDTDHWLYRWCVEAPPAGTLFFEQPSGLSPYAENLQRLERMTPGYYQAQAAINADDPDYVRRMVRNEWGYSRDGKPVYPEYADQLHVASGPIAFDPTRPLVIGADAGLTPAAVFLQRDGWGRWAVIDELCWEGGASRFGEAINRRLADGYKGVRPAAIRAWGDPAAAARSAVEKEERSWLAVVTAETKIPFRPAPLPSNALTPRLEAVRSPLRRLVDGRPGLIVSPACKVLRKGFNSGYRYRRMKVPGAERYDDKPEKNEFSHVHDALQYALVGAGEHHEALGRQAARADHGRPVQARHDFDVFGGAA